MMNIVESLAKKSKADLAGSLIVAMPSSMFRHNPSTLPVRTGLMRPAPGEDRRTQHRTATSEEGPAIRRTKYRSQSHVLLVDPNTAGEGVTADEAEYGYAGVTVDPLERVVDVYWVGTVDVEAQRILDDAPAGVTVRVHQAKYTYSEMLDALDRVVACLCPGALPT